MAVKGWKREINPRSRLSAPRGSEDCKGEEAPGFVQAEWGIQWLRMLQARGAAHWVLRTDSSVLF